MLCVWHELQHHRQTRIQTIYSPVEKTQKDEEEAERHGEPTGVDMEHVEKVNHSLHNVKLLSALHCYSQIKVP